VFEHGNHVLRHAANIVTHEGRINRQTPVRMGSCKHAMHGP
jgi:hypothetical protein